MNDIKKLKESLDEIASNVSLNESPVLRLADEYISYKERTIADLDELCDSLERMAPELYNESEKQMIRDMLTNMCDKIINGLEKMDPEGY